jgi:alkylation response protein AidB-like acyl-CoA dehydrogenase
MSAPTHTAPNPAPASGVAPIYAFTAEHHELRDMVRRFLVERSSEERVREIMETDTGHDPDNWALMAELGLQGLLVPTEYGGAGSGMVETQIVCEEMGAALYCGPFLGSAVLATSALVESGDEQAKQRYLPALAQGSLTGTLAVTEAAGTWELDRLTTHARRSGDTGEFLLTGEKMFVLDGLIADLILVAARTDDGLGLFAVSGDAAGLRRDAMATLDPTRRLATITFTDTSATALGAPGTAESTITAAFHNGVAALAAEQAGGARRTLDTSVGYAKIREQFGRPIGAYQAIKHRCADMVVAAESAVSAAFAVGWAIDRCSDEVALLASLAKAYCSQAYYECAAANIQIHGGVGFTWEHSAQLYFKRATSSQVLLGTPHWHRDILSRLLVEGLAPQANA